jgi:DNA polymerase-3 subunit epsilon
LLRRRAGRSAAARAYARARRRDEDEPWRRARYAVVDLETTGLDPRHDEIVSFAAVPVDEGRIVVGAISTMIVRPTRMPAAETIRIHGLRPVDLEQAPELPAVLDRILEALTARVLVAHAAWIERDFLTEALRPQGLRPPDPIVDTAALATRVLGADLVPAGRTPPLSETARVLGLPVHRPHIAEGDALTTAQLFLALASRLDRDGSQTVGSLAGRGRTR